MGCAQSPHNNKDMMEEHRKKGFDDWMDRAPVQESYSGTRQAGWAELFVTIGAVAVIALIAWLVFR